MSDVAFYMQRRTWIIAGAVVILGIAIAAPLMHRRGRVEYVTAKVERGEIDDVVDSTGIVNAVVNVQVGSQVSGTISKLHADFNSKVHKGEVIAEIDPRLLDGAVLQATSDLKNAQANVVAAKANVNKARAVLVQTRADYERAVAMTKKNIGTQQALDQAKASYDAAQASVEAAAAAVHGRPQCRWALPNPTPAASLSLHLLLPSPASRRRRSPQSGTRVRQDSFQEAASRRNTDPRFKSA